MMHDGMWDDGTQGDGGECYYGEENGEDNEEEKEEEDFLEEMLHHVEAEFLLKAAKGLNNVETLKKVREKRLYEEAKGCEKRWSLLTLCARHADLEGQIWMVQ